MAQQVELVSVVTAMIAMGTGAVQWRRRHESDLAAPLAMVMAGGGTWAATHAVAVLAQPEAVKITATYLRFPGVVVLVAAALWYCAVLAGHRAVPSRRLVGLLCIEPAAVAVLAVTDARHRLLFRTIGYGADGHFVVDFGPAFWVHTAYSYALLATGMILVLRALWHSVAGHRKVLVLALLSLLVPIFGNAVSVRRPGGAEAVDLTPVLFLVTAGFWMWIERYRTDYRAVPVSTRDVLDSLGDAVAVLDSQGHVLQVNPAAERLLVRPGAPRTVGARWREVVPPELVVALDGVDQVTVTTGGAVLDVRVTRLTADAGRPRGAVVVARDVTELERLRADLAELAVRDPLTGLFNRRHLEDALRRAVEEARVDGEDLAVVVVDIDRFKAVNDTYGHAVGDEVLVDVAQELQRAVRPQDVVARLGGEEFVVVLPRTSLEVARQRAESWRRHRAARRVRTAAGEMTVTLSAGVAAPWPGTTAAELLALADGALYAAKDAGRDRVVVAEVADAARFRNA